MDLHLQKSASEMQTIFITGAERRYAEEPKQKAHSAPAAPSHRGFDEIQRIIERITAAAICPS
jgi:hypothetical protein